MPLDTGLVSIWSMDTGATRPDDVSTNHLLEVNGPLGTSEGLIDDSAVFVGADDQLLERDDGGANFRVGDQPYTWGLWVYPVDLSINQRFLAKWNATNGREFTLEFNASNGFPRLLLRNSADDGNGEIWATSVSLTENAWHQIVGWHDPDNDRMGIQVDNGTRHETDFAGGVQTGTQDSRFTVGGLSRVGSTITDAGSTLDGQVDQTAVWNRVLSAADVDEWYGGGAGIPFPFPTSGGIDGDLRGGGESRLWAPPHIQVG